MDLSAYFARIGLSAPPPATLEGLRQIHRAQAYAVPYDAIDVHLGRPVTQDLEAVFDKIVTRRRGGWCYETNGLLAWALTLCGFSVRRMTGAVYRSQRGRPAEGNHVALMVTLPEGRFLADLGVSDFLREPIPLLEGFYHQDGMRFELTRTGDGWWRLLNDPAAIPTDFDFHDGPADEARIAERHDFLQKDPLGTFVLNFEAIRMRPGGADMVIGRVLTERDGAEKRERLISGPEELDHILRSQLGLAVPGVEASWPRILDRHAELFGAPDAPV